MHSQREEPSLNLCSPLSHLASLSSWILPSIPSLLTILVDPFLSTLQWAQVFPSDTFKGTNRTTLLSSPGSSSWELWEQLQSGRHCAHLPDLLVLR